MIEVTDFCKAYETQVAVRGVSFRVAPGEVLGLVGPNGAGKTTTLRALTGIIPASGGTLSVAGFDIERQPMAAKQRTGYVPDDPQLFHDLTVQDHLAFTASVYQVQDAAARSSELLRQFDLEAKRDTAAADLSRGMRQKLAICCAYLPQPSAVLLDEPMTGLDPRGIRVFKESVQRLSDAGAAVIISSHLLAMVEDICTHVMILNQGRQKFIGPLSELGAQLTGCDDQASLEE
ncbi:MAG: ABC transporter ATP-binding protein, partial [Planctomycetota bacterium]